MMIFLIFSQLMGHPLTKLSHLSNLLQMPNDYRMVKAEFFGSFLCIFKRISFEWWLSVVVNFWWPATVLLIFKAVVSFAKLLEPPLHCALISTSWVRCVVDVELSLLLYNPFWTQIRKLLKFAFCPTSFPYSKTVIKYMAGSKSLAKNIKWEMHIKMMYNITAFI